MIVVKYLLWEGNEHDYYQEEIMDIVDKIGIPEWCDIVEYAYPYAAECHFEPTDLVRLSNWRLQHAIPTNYRFYLVGCEETEGLKLWRD